VAYSGIVFRFCPGLCPAISLSTSTRFDPDGRQELSYDINFADMPELYIIKNVHVLVLRRTKISGLESTIMS
jgi:hypothetical protein